MASISKTNTVRNLLTTNFPHTPTQGQAVLIDKLSYFLTDTPEGSLFVLQGYAGTGKTTIVKSIVASLPALKSKSVLLAPTGRAAKVLSLYSEKKAFTIHKKIYRMAQSEGGGMFFARQPNLHTNTVFIVDEASMISGADQGQEGSSTNSLNILDDILHYVNEGSNCRLIFIGDTAQLPPVGMSLSHALDVEYLQKNYHFPALYFHQLTDVVRQKLESGILYNATQLRDTISNAYEQLSFRDISILTQQFPDIIALRGEELGDALNSSYSKYGSEGTMIVTRSNKRANQFNAEVRARIHYYEEELCGGDFLMVVKNNYFWLPKESESGFIANGDMIELLRVRNIRELYGFRFADASVRLVDYPEEKPIEVKLLLNTLASETPSLSYTENKKLFDAVLQDYDHIPSRGGKIREVKNNPYFNALQVKFGYAVTCHKAQGGQWEHVFVDQGYLTEEMINTDYLRWLYTSFTRATEKLYLVNFNNAFFGKDD